MAIVVVGGGAIGLQVAGRLALGGIESALLARPSGVDALAAGPLRISSPDGAREVRIEAAASPADLLGPYRRPDLAVLCVKGYDTPGAIETLRALAPRLLLTLQNGIGNEERLVAAFGPTRVIAGAITTSVEAPGPTEIVITKAGGVGLAPVDPATDLGPWAAAFTAAGFPVKTYGDYRAMKWSKALLNMLGNAQAAILDMQVPQIYADARLLDLDLAAAREALAVMARMGARPVNLPGYPAATVAALARFLPGPALRPLMRRLVGGGRGGKDPSLLRDLRAGRKRSEGEQLYGAVAAEAAARGVPAPVNAALWRILGGIVRGEIAWGEYRGKPERLLAEVGR
ncbi:MAG: ketopantoate reductase family protein [Chloroflexales bacterium]|nr:ketopantoate reductase family protein [Chloroflexales bacterium]